MQPKILKGEADYKAARSYIEFLKGQEPSSDRDAELELWSVLIERYEGVVAPKAKPKELKAERAVASEPIAPNAKELWWPDLRVPMGWGTLAFFLFTASMLYLRLMYRVGFFPPFFEGEESKVLEWAKDTCEFAAYTNSWWEAFKGGLIEYNKGFSWVLVPFYEYFGFDVRLIMYVIPAIYSILIGTFLTIYRKTYPRSSLLSFFVIVMFSVLCVALRRYKWHTVSYVTALSVYLYFLPEFYKGAFFLGDRWRKALAVFLFALSCYLYFGSLLYVGPVFLLVVILSTKKQRRIELVLGCLGFAVFAAVFGVVYHTSERWKVRVWEELRSISQDISHDGMLKVWWSLRDFLFTLDLSIPYLIFFVVGLVTSFKMIRRGDRFALINTTLFLSIFPFQMLIGGLNNPDQTNWLMIPLLGVLLIGTDRVLLAIRERVRHGVIIGLILVLFVGWNELRHYLPLSNNTPYQSFSHDRNTRTQVALVLRMIRDDDSGSVQYYMPSPQVPEKYGGYDYTASLNRVDYAKAFSKITYFESEEDLRGKLMAQKNRKKAVVYLSVGFTDPGEEDTLKKPLLGQDPEIIHPYEEIYETPYLVRKFTFDPAHLR